MMAVPHTEVRCFEPAIKCNPTCTFDFHYIKNQIPSWVSGFFGGLEGDRTLGLTDANRTLSQLSYEPVTAGDPQ